AGGVTGAAGVAGATSAAAGVSAGGGRARAASRSRPAPGATAATCEGAEDGDGRANNAGSHGTPFFRRMRRERCEQATLLGRHARGREIDPAAAAAGLDEDLRFFHLSER